MVKHSKGQGGKGQGGKSQGAKAPKKGADGYKEPSQLGGLRAHPAFLVMLPLLAFLLVMSAPKDPDRKSTRLNSSHRT